MVDIVTQQLEHVNVLLDGADPIVQHPLVIFITIVAGTVIAHNQIRVHVIQNTVDCHVIVLIVLMEIRLLNVPV